MESPKRIQRKRTKGWKMPENTIYVGRGSQWGNPFRVEYMYGGLWGVKTSIEAYFDILTSNCRPAYETKEAAVLDAVKCHEILVRGNMLIKNDITVALQGLNLACWCAEGAPCHGNLLLKIANE